MSDDAGNRRLTYAEYLAAEVVSDEKHEFVGGEMFAMAGGTRPHSSVQTAVVVLLGDRLRGKSCRPQASDARVFFPAYGDSAYPDAHVVCGKPVRAEGDRDAVVNPTLVVEVLSPSTELWDRGGKFERYESLPSLQEYVLVTVDRRRVEIFRRNPDNTFNRIVFSDGDEVEFRSIEVRFPISELYLIADAEAAEELEA